MAKVLSDAVFDAALAVVATCDNETACSSQPANFAGIAAVTLATIVNTSDYTGPANGDASGRKIAVDAQAGDTVDASGTATYIVLDDGATLHVATTCTSQALTSGNTVNYPAWDIEITDPT